MIDRIRVKNYKAFETASIPIKPITILLGANSVGKSSIIQLLLLLQQTAKENIKSYKSALKLYGGCVNLGDGKNLFRNFEIDKPLEFGFILKSKFLSSVFRNYFDEYIGYLESVPQFIPIKGFLKLKQNFGKISSREDYKQYIETFFDIFTKDVRAKNYIENAQSFLRGFAHIDLSQQNQENKKNLLRTYDFLHELSKIKNDTSFDISIKLNYVRNNLCLAEYEISAEGNSLIRFADIDDDFCLYSDFVKFSDTEKSELKTYFNKNNTIFHSFNKKNESTSLTYYALDIISSSLQFLQSEFSEYKINYVSPLRAHPKRYYMLDKAKMNISLDTLDGDSIADVLKENSLLNKSVNKWLSKFNLRVDVEEFKEVVHHVIVSQNNLKLNISDVGFGISQVLPVIIQGFLSTKDSTTIIEQPEIHLHPQMQADLADLFIEMVQQLKNKRIIIETHSEYLLKRLRRRISEGKIKSEDVSICLFHPQKENEGGRIEELSIKKKGFFEWPEDFYGGEIYNDTLYFLKNQID